MIDKTELQDLTMEICRYLVPGAYQKDTPPITRAEDIAANLLRSGYVKKGKATTECHMKQVSYRYRVNISQTSTGKYSFDCTCESEGASMADVLAESDKLVQALKERYPIEVKEEKK